MAQAKRPEAIKLLESMPSEGLRRADIIIMLAQAYPDEQQYDETINLLESTPYFVNWEGQTITWDLFHRAHMKRGQNRFEAKDFAGALKDFEAALTYPDNIGVGRSNRPQEADAQYWKGKALQSPRTPGRGEGRLEGRGGGVGRPRRTEQVSAALPRSLGGESIEREIETSSNVQYAANASSVALPDPGPFRHLGS